MSFNLEDYLHQKDLNKFKLKNDVSKSFDGIDLKQTNNINEG